MSIIELNANLNDMQEYEALPAGNYKAEIRDVEERFSEKMPNGYYYIQLVVPPAEFPADYDPENAPEGVILTYARVGKPDPTNRRTVRPFKVLIEAMGLDSNSNTFNMDDWIGREVQALVSQDEYQGSPTNQVQSLSPVPTV